MKVKWTNASYYDVEKVPSKSEPGAFHIVIMDGMRAISCDITCKGFEYRGTCRHLQEAETQRIIRMSEELTRRKQDGKVDHSLGARRKRKSSRS